MNKSEIGTVVKTLKLPSPKSLRLRPKLLSPSSPVETVLTPTTARSLTTSPKLLNSMIKPIVHVKEKKTFKEKHKRPKIIPTANSLKTRPSTTTTNHELALTENRKTYVSVKQEAANQMAVSSSQQPSVNHNANPVVNNFTNHLNGTSPPVNTSSRSFANPLYWTAKDVCKYLIENKFDQHLVYLIEEHVIFCLF